MTARGLQLSSLMLACQLLLQHIVHCGHYCKATRPWVESGQHCCYLSDTTTSYYLLLQTNTPLHTLYGRLVNFYSTYRYFPLNLVQNPTVWNGLPLNIRLSPTFDTFKRRLKTHLFK